MVALRVALTKTKVMDIRDYTLQEPSGLGLSNAITMVFGSPTLSDDSVFTSENGVLTINETLPNEYEIKVSIRIARPTSAGKAEVLAWGEISTDGVNWSPLPTGVVTTSIEDNASSSSIAFGELVLEKGTPAGTLLRARFGRQDGAHNSGSLTPVIRSGSYSGVGINDTHSCRMTITKYQALSS